MQLRYVNLILIFTHFTSLIDENKKKRRQYAASQKKVACLMIFLTWLTAKQVLLPCHLNFQSQRPHLEHERLKRSQIALP